MARLPSKDKKQGASVQRIWSVSLSEELEAKMIAEVERTGVASRSELMRMIFEEYFKQEIE